ncbi:MAG: helix-turn-helix transcriptional regulator, partial [Pseudonocardiales bacterium]|nr:helix-turn-helix transcriptional regulator [Pseudonocardiales bacterium]
RLDFGLVFRRVRVETRWSQHRLGVLLDVDQATICRIENGRRSLTDAATVIRVANVLGIPAGKLGFRCGVSVGAGRATGWTKGSWVERRDFVERVAGLTLGLSGVVGLDLDRLIALLPDAEPTGTRHLGVADVAAIEQATAEFRRQDFTYGSASTHDSAVTQLRATLPLVGAQIAPAMRPRLLLATADLATEAGWMSFDAKQHDAARRLWLIGLDLARAAEHPQGADLTVYLLADMALQALRLQRPDEALRLVRLGHTATVSPHPVSASTLSLLANVEARTLAVRGEAVGCDRALGQALEHFSAIEAATAPPWTSYLAHTGISGAQGSACYLLALQGQQPRTASRAVPLLRSAVDGFGPDYASLRAFYLPDLAGAHALAGDIDTAVSVGHQAIDAVTALHSPDSYGQLRALNTALQPLHTSPGVAELRSRLAATAA